MASNTRYPVNFYDLDSGNISTAPLSYGQLLPGVAILSTPLDATKNALNNIYAQQDLKRLFAPAKFVSTTSGLLSTINKINIDIDSTLAGHNAYYRYGSNYIGISVDYLFDPSGQGREDLGIQAEYSFSPSGQQFASSLTRALTHELIHGLLEPIVDGKFAGEYNKYREDPTIFLENFISTNYFSGDDALERVGHDPSAPAHASVSAVDYLKGAKLDAIVGRKMAGENNDVAFRFTLANGDKLRKTYYAPNQDGLDHEVRIDLATAAPVIAANGTVSATVGTILNDSVVRNDYLLQTMEVASDVDDYHRLASALNSVASGTPAQAIITALGWGNYALDQTNLVTLSAERFTDTGIDVSGPVDTGKTTTLQGATTVTLKAAGGTRQGSVIFGVGGYRGTEINLATTKDSITGSAANDVIFTGGGIFDRHSLVNSGAGNDIINVGSGAYADVNSGAGNDLILFSGKGGTINGGAGFDTLSFANEQHGVTVTTNKAGGFKVSGLQDISVRNVEAFRGTQYDDSFTAGPGTNAFIGGSGADVFNGGGGFDIFVGGYDGDIYNLVGKGDEYIDLHPGGTAGAGSLIRIGNLTSDIAGELTIVSPQAMCIQGPDNMVICTGDSVSYTPIFNSLDVKVIDDATKLDSLRFGPSIVNGSGNIASRIVRPIDPNAPAYEAYIGSGLAFGYDSTTSDLLIWHEDSRSAMETFPDGTTDIIHYNTLDNNQIIIVKNFHNGDLGINFTPDDLQGITGGQPRAKLFGTSEILGNTEGQILSRFFGGSPDSTGQTAQLASVAPLSSDTTTVSNTPVLAGQVNQLIQAMATFGTPIDAMENLSLSPAHPASNAPIQLAATLA